MTSSACSTSQPSAARDGDVCRSRGVVLVVGDNERALEAADALPRGLRAVVLAPGPRGADTARRTVVGGRVVSLEGSLARFRAKAATGASTSTDIGTLSPNADGCFDLVLDLQRVPLIPATAASLGYFAASDARELQAALAIAPLLVGTFHDPRPGYVRVRAASCTGCAACANACPTRALVAEGRRTVRLLLREAACVQCGSCLTACPEGAVSSIRLASAVRPAPAVLLAEVTRAVCAGCGEAIPDHARSASLIRSSADFTGAARRALLYCPSCRARSLFAA